MNAIEITGNLGQAPEQKFTPNGKKMTRFSVASNESYKDAQGKWQKRTDWFHIIAWGRNGDKAMLLKSGDMVLVKGPMRSREHEGKTYWEVTALTLMKVDPLRISGAEEETDGGDE